MRATRRTLSTLAVTLLLTAQVQLSGADEVSRQSGPQPPQRAAPKKSVVDWVRELADKDPRKRGEAARALGELGKEARAALPALAGLLQDREAEVRRRAADAVHKIGVGRAEATALLAALEAKDSEVRSAAVW